jgi:hypothetical protein
MFPRSVRGSATKSSPFGTVVLQVRARVGSYSTLAVEYSRRRAITISFFFFFETVLLEFQHIGH